MGELAGLVRARTSWRLPVVLTRDEVKAVLSELDGDLWLMASLMYGAGLSAHGTAALAVTES